MLSTRDLVSQPEPEADNACLAFTPCTGKASPDENDASNDDAVVVTSANAAAMKTAAAAAKSEKDAKEAEEKKVAEEKANEDEEDSATASFMTFAPCVGLCWLASRTNDEGSTRATPTTAEAGKTGNDDSPMETENKNATTSGACAGHCLPRIDTIDSGDHDEGGGIFNSLFDTRTVGSNGISDSDSLDAEYDTKKQPGFFAMLRRMVPGGDKDAELKQAIVAVRTISSRKMSDVQMERAISGVSNADEEDSLHSHDSFTDLKEAVRIVKKHSRRLGVSEREFIRTLSQGDLKNDDFVTQVGKVTDDFFDALEDNLLATTMSRDNR
jgi:hypothetical protein